MKREKISEIIENIDNKYIEEAAEYNCKVKNISNLRIIKFISAACICVLVITFASYQLYNSHNSVNSNNNFSNDVQLPPSYSHSQTTSDSEKMFYVFQGKKTPLFVAKKIFGHNIKECTKPEFTGYTIGSFSEAENSDGNEKRECIDVIYGFTNGTIKIADQDRMGSPLYSESSEKIEYDGHIFIVESSVSDKEYISYGYYPTDEKGLAYIAEFDKSTDKEEIFDLILSVIV